MDVHNTIGGSLQISTEVIAKIARLAALEVDGIATVTVHITVVYGNKVMPLCEKVQENVKQAIQNMTGITVARVDVLVVGLTETPAEKK